jgi:hypothetical protein
MGRKERRASDMGYDSCSTVLKLSIFGYISRGDMVPEVMMTDKKRSKTGLMAIEASRQVK